MFRTIRERKTFTTAFVYVTRIHKLTAYSVIIYIKRILIWVLKIVKKLQVKSQFKSP